LQRYGGRVAVVTGGSRGIGFSIAQRLVSEGAQVCITGRHSDALSVAVESLGGSVSAIAVTGAGDDEGHQREAIESVMQTFGRLDLLVNNVGLNPAYGPLFELEPAARRKILDVNVLGSLSWTQMAVEAGLGKYEGSVVNVASVAGLRAAEGIGFYGVSKAAIMQLTQQLAWELAPAVRVNAVAPAVVKTRFASLLYEGKESEVADAYPLKRLGDPEDVAAAVVFLGSADASWITGQTLVVDGGLTLGGGV
jgi:NAD(P)-dependent dehydrogenase (short-subunit alcohol dehydrogenase family)